MDWTNQVRGVLGRYADRRPGPHTVADTSRVASDFEQVVRAAPRPDVVAGLAAALNGAGGKPFGETVCHLFRLGTPEQKAGLLKVLASLKPASGPDELLAFVAGEKDITPQQAREFSPERVARLAGAAQRAEPHILNRIAEYLADHPKLAKNLSAQALGNALAAMSGPQQRQFGAGSA